MQKITALLVCVLTVVSLASCGKKNMTEETTVPTTNTYEQPNTSVPATTERDNSLIGEVTSIADDIKNDIVGDSSTSASTAQ